MAGFQTANLMAPEHPVLYGTTLAISLVGSVAALGSVGISASVARVEYALGLAENAPAAVTSAPALNAAQPATIKEPAASKQAEVLDVETPERMAAIPEARQVNSAPIGLEAVQRLAVPKLAKADFAAPQLELTSTPEAIAAPVSAESHGQQLEPPVAAPPAADVAAPPNQSFVAAFQAIPAPSLAVLPEPQDAVPIGASTVSHASAPIALTAAPGQGLTDQPVAGSTPGAAAWQSKRIDLAIAVPATMTVLANAPETVLAPAQVPSKLAAPSGPVPVATSLQKAAARPAAAAPTVRLINSPELRKFDLARIHVPARKPTAALARPAAKPAQVGKVRATGAKDKLVGDVVFHQVTVTVAGSPAKPLDVRIGADMKPSIRVGDLLGLVSDRMDPANAARFASAASADEYVSLAALRAAGFSISYNAGTDSISIGPGN